MNENEYDDLNKRTLQPDDVITYSPDGLFAYTLLTHFGIPCTDSRIPEAWALFENYARKYYGSGSGIAAITFGVPGGEFEKLMIDGDFDDDDWDDEDMD